MGDVTMKEGLQVGRYKRPLLCFQAPKASGKFPRFLETTKEEVGEVCFISATEASRVPLPLHEHMHGVDSFAAQGGEAFVGTARRRSSAGCSRRFR